MDSTNSNVHFRFDVLLHPRLFSFVINAADTCKYALNETRAFCAMNEHVERYGALFVSKLFLSVVSFHCLFRYVFYLRHSERYCGIYIFSVSCTHHPVGCNCTGYKLSVINLHYVGCTHSSVAVSCKYLQCRLYTRLSRYSVGCTHYSTTCKIYSVSCSQNSVGCTHYSVGCT